MYTVTLPGCNLANLRPGLLPAPSKAKGAMAADAAAEWEGAQQEEEEPQLGLENPIGKIPAWKRS